jgi:hypothetical protein
MNRDQMETHLMLQGWRPFAWGMGAAYRGDLIVYAFYSSQFEPRREIKVAEASTSPQNADEVYPRKVFDVWIMSDAFFWKLARHIEAKYGS